MMIGTRRAIMFGNHAAVHVPPADAPQTIAFLARTSGLDATHIAAYKALINGLVADGVWPKLDALWVDATQDSATAVLNLKSASHTATLEGGISFAADVGFNSFGDSSKRVVRNWKPITDGVNYQETDACIGFYDWQAAEDYQRAAFFDAPHGSEGMFLVVRYPGAGAGIINFNDNDQSGFPSTDGSGRWHASRNGAVIKTFQNDVELASHTTVSSGPPPDQNLCTGEWHNGAIGYLYIGGDLTPALRTACDARLATYMASI